MILNIKTERLLIRTAKKGDEVPLNQAIHESQHQLREYMTWLDPLPTLEETRQNLARTIQLTEEKKDIRLLLFLHDGTFVGSSGLHGIDWDVPKAEIGYWVRTSMSGRGYITEAVKAITQYGLDELGMKRLEIIISGTNQRSLAVVKRVAGYQLEGVLRNHRVDPSGELADTHVYAKVV